MLKSGNKASRASKPEKHSDHGNDGPGMIQRAAWPQSATPADEGPRGRAGQYIVSLADVGTVDVSRVGGKNASLGEMIRSLKETAFASRKALPRPQMPIASTLRSTTLHRSFGRSSRS